MNRFEISMLGMRFAASGRVGIAGCIVLALALLVYAWLAP